MRADTSACGAGLGAFSDVRRIVAWEGARSHRSHDDVRSFHLTLVLMKFDCFFRQMDHCSERRLDDESASDCNCARRTRDANAIVASVDFALLIAETRWRLQRLLKSLSFFAACFGASFVGSIGRAGRGAITAELAVRATIRGSLGVQALDAEARRAIMSSEAEAGDGGAWR